QSDRERSDQGGDRRRFPGVPGAEGVARGAGPRRHRLRLPVLPGAAGDRGHAEVAAGGERDDEGGVEGEHRGHHLLLPRLRVLRLRGVRGRHPREPPHRLRGPYWLVGLANLCVVLHLLGGYQVYAQPMFALVERRFGAGVVDAEVPLLGRVSVSRLCFRTANVAAATAVAVWFPYFNQVVGLIGAFTFWPLAIHFPVQMYLAQGKVAPWTGRWLAIQAFSAGCLVACGFASVGSAMGVFGPERS
uniref:Amino acid transporter transmembrane domain-containing protein n=1 Tax=Aegilops tauschii subsp. strangulata TaxID=200361 RepID=A0A453PFX4_AEGTS